MVVYNIKELLKLKSNNESKKLSYKDIENVTGINRVQLSRLNSKPNYPITAYHLEKLCRYFNCTPNDLIKIYDEPPNYALFEFNPSKNR